MKNKFEKIFEQLADFHMLDGYDGWMIGACVYAQREENCKLCGYAESDRRGWNRVSAGVACGKAGGAGGSY